MSIDTSITRLAFREAESLGVAQALVAKKRADLELKLLREAVLKSDGASGASIETALRDMRDESESVVRPPTVLDKLA